MRNLRFLKRFRDLLNLKKWFNFIINRKHTFLKLICRNFKNIFNYLIHLSRVNFIIILICFTILKLNSYLSFFFILILLELKWIITKNDNTLIFYFRNNWWYLFLIISFNFLNLYCLKFIIHFHSERKNGAYPLLWLDCNITFKLISNHFTNVKSKPYAFFIKVLVVFYFAKKFK